MNHSCDELKNLLNGLLSGSKVEPAIIKKYNELARSELSSVKTLDDIRMKYLSSIKGSEMEKLAFAIHGLLLQKIIDANSRQELSDLYREALYSSEVKETAKIRLSKLFLYEINELSNYKEVYEIYMSSSDSISTKAVAKSKALSLWLVESEDEFRSFDIFV